MVPLLTFLSQSPWLFDHSSLLALCYAFALQGTTARQYLSPLGSRNTSTAFKQCFGWFLLRLMWSHSKKELFTSLHCHYSIVYGYQLSEERDQDGEKPWGQDLQEAAEVTWLVYHGEEKAEELPHCSLQLPQGEQQRWRCSSPLCGVQW